MKVLYIGDCNSFSAQLTDRFVKEENEVYIISSHGFSKGVKPQLRHKVYLCTREDRKAEKVYESICPDMVIFAGEGYLKQHWVHDGASKDYLAWLLDYLELAVRYGTKRFLYLSTSQVLVNGSGLRGEETATAPVTYKGMLAEQGERLVRDMGRLNNLHTLILRIDSIYGCGVHEHTGDFIEEIVGKAAGKGIYRANKNRIFYPLYISDCVEAIYKMQGMTPSSVYHAAGKTPWSETRVAALAAKESRSDFTVEEYDGAQEEYALDCGRIKKELEWVQFYELDEIMEKGRVNLQLDSEEEGRQEKKDSPRFLFMILENIVVFFVFAMFSAFLRRSSILSNIDFMVIYILVMSLMFGIRQSILSVILACGFYLAGSGVRELSVSGILMNVETVIHFALYIFIGVSVGYTVEKYRVSLKEKENEYAYLNREYLEVKEINQDNIFIKQEYEKRLLSNKSSLPKLYSIINQLTSLEPDKILSEAIAVIHDIMETDTVAVYLAKEGSSYLRLIASLNEESYPLGKSLNLEEYPRMQRLLLDDELYIGSQWEEKEPALAAPIFYRRNCIAVILIQKMKFSGLNQYHINLFRTLSVLITSSIVKAEQYTETVRDRLFIKDTEIYVPEEFRKLLQIQKEKKEKGLADYSILRFCSRNLEDVYDRTKNLFRNTDSFGVDEDGNLYILLGNTDERNLNSVISRLEQRGVRAVRADALPKAEGQSKI